MVKVYPEPLAPALVPVLENEVVKPRRKETIPKALREQVWIRTAGRQFEVQCPIHWCRNTITAFDFHVGHNIPEREGGSLDLDNLKPLCARCNLSMGSQYTIDRWNKMVVPEVTNTRCIGCYPWFKGKRAKPK